jgi:CBS domain-containing protein
MMLVHHILPDARRRLAVLSREASVHDAANILINTNTPLVVVCDSDGIAVGVISRTNLIKAFSRPHDEACNMNAEEVMTTLMLSCRVDETLQSLWASMGVRGLRCAPVLDACGRPQGVVHARDVARALLEEVENEEGLLRDYVLGIGYQ